MTQEPSWPPEPLHVAVDVVAFSVLDDRVAVLLWRRPYPPFEGRWALPGTFSRQDETLDESPRRALAEKTGIEQRVHLEQLATYDLPPRGDTPGRDPRGRVVSVAHLALLRDPGATADRAGVAWWSVDELPDPLAFDHARMVRDGRTRLRAKTRYAGLAFELLPDHFTLPEAQAVYEAILGEELDVRNFRRDLHAAGVIEEIGDTRADGPGRPARLYRKVPGRFAVDAGERRMAERIARHDR